MRHELAHVSNVKNKNLINADTALMGFLWFVKASSPCDHASKPQAYEA